MRWLNEELVCGQALKDDHDLSVTPIVFFLFFFYLQDKLVYLPLSNKILMLDVYAHIYMAISLAYRQN